MSSVSVLLFSWLVVGASGGDCVGKATRIVRRSKSGFHLPQSFKGFASRPQGDTAGRSNPMRDGNDGR